MHTKIIYKELSYIIQGCAFDLRKRYGASHKESVYANLLLESLTSKKVNVVKEKRIPVYSQATGAVMGWYQPDLVVEEIILIELKATTHPLKRDADQVIDYLKNSRFELGYLINFGSYPLYLKRFIFTNDRKPFLPARS